MITGNQKLITKEQSSFTELIEHQEAIILDLENLYYYSLNAAATLLWKHLRAGSASTQDTLSQKLSEAFGLPAEVVAADTQEFIETLLQHHLLAYTEGEVTGHGNFVMPVASDLPVYEAPRLKTSNAVMEMSLATMSSTATPGSSGS